MRLCCMVPVSWSPALIWWEMKRALLLIICSGTIASAIALGVVWVRSYYTSDNISGSSDYCVGSFVQSEDFELEEVGVSEAVCLSLHGFDLVICAFQWPGGDRTVIVGQNTPAMLGQGHRELLKHSDARRLGAGDPVVEEDVGRGFVALVPDLPQVFLHVVDRGQWLVEGEGFFQAFAFVAFIVEVFGVLEQQPAGSLEHLPGQRPLRFTLQLLAKQRELLVEELDHMKAVEHMAGLGQMIADGGSVRGRHVGGHGLDAGVRAMQPFPERKQGISPWYIGFE